MGSASLCFVVVRTLVVGTSQDQPLGRSGRSNNLVKVAHRNCASRKTNEVSWPFECKSLLELHTFRLEISSDPALALQPCRWQTARVD